MNDLESKVDDLEERCRVTSAILESANLKFRSEDTFKADTMNFINRKLQHKLDDSDVSYMLHIPTRRATNKVKIVFKSLEIRNHFMSIKPALRGLDTWISDDLTSTKSRLAFMAREIVHKEKAFMTWVNDGVIYMRIKPDDETHEIAKKTRELHLLCGRRNYAVGKGLLRGVAAATNQERDLRGAAVSNNHKQGQR